MVFSMVSLINENLEVCSLSLKDKHTESHLQNTDLQRSPLVTSGTMGLEEEKKKATLI